MADTHRRTTINKDGICLEMCGDGSCSFRVVRPEGGRGFGLNERLHEERRRRPKGEPEWSSVGIGICKTASVLRYQKSRSGDPASFYWKIHSDLDRMHMPQPWAKGVMPLISSRRFWHWTQTQDRRALEYQLPEGREAQKDALWSHLSLLLGQWKFLFNHPTAVRNVLVGQGYEVKHTEIRRLIHRVRQDSGFFRPGNGGGFLFGPNIFETRPEELLAYWADVAAPFEALALVPEADLRPNRDYLRLPTKTEPEPLYRRFSRRRYDWEDEAWGE